jgi:glycosyltransferase involved in cell wall biosynthesis
MTTSIPRAPLVSVVMAVKNGGQLMREAIDSILNQTFTDFEFIIINDGSTDNTLEILGEYQDPRIQVYSQENRGVARSANRGLALARGKYIARQDHDDVSLPTRLQKQVEYLEIHPECGLLGTAAEIWGPSGPTGRFHDHPTSSSLLKFELIFDNPFVHTSVMFRRGVIKTMGLYDPRSIITPLDDYHFISRVSRSFLVSNLTERLVVYRENNNSLTSSLRSNSEDILKKKLGLISGENLSYYSSESIKKNAIKIAFLYHVDIKKVVLIQDVKLVNAEIKKIANGMLIADDVETINRAINAKIAHIKYRAFVEPGSAHLLAKIFINYSQKAEDIFYRSIRRSRKVLSRLKKTLTFKG